MRVHVKGKPIIVATSMAQATFAATARISTVDTVADVAGSLNNTYFFLFSANHSTVYTVWFNIGTAGIDPKIPNTTSVEIAVASSATANAIATQMRSVIGALSDFGTGGATNQVIITNAATGTASEPYEETGSIEKPGTGPGFTYATTAIGEIIVSNPTFIRIIGKVLISKDYWNNNSYVQQPFNYVDIDIVVNERMIMEVWDS